MKLCTNFGTRLGMQGCDLSACHFGGARKKGFATLRNVLKLLPNDRSCFGISSRYLRVLWSVLILIYYSGQIYWPKRYLTENIEAVWVSSFKIRAKIEMQEQFSVRLTFHTSLHMSSYVSRDIYPPLFTFNIPLSFNNNNWRTKGNLQNPLTTQKWMKNKQARDDAVIPCHWMLHIQKGGERFKKVTKITSAIRSMGSSIDGFQGME